MGSRNFIAMSFILIAVAASAFQGSHLMLQWWSGFLPQLWNGIWGIISSAFISPHPAVVLTVQQQFQNQLSSMQNETGSLSALYVSSAQQYAVQITKQRFTLNQSWSLQITDRNSTSSPVIGNMTITWMGPSRTFLIESGIVSHNVSPTYAAAGSHSVFMKLSNDTLRMDVLSGIADYLTYNSSKSITYRFVR